LKFDFVQSDSNKEIEESKSTTITKISSADRNFHLH